jgi:long-chain acyl-CoA synthetase
MTPSGYTGLTIGRGIRCAATGAPDKIALGDTSGAALTYAGLVARMDGVGRMAAARGLKPGDVVALVTPNCMEYPEIVAGLSEHGIIVATLNPQLSPDELALIFEDCCPRLVIAAETTELPRNAPPTIRLGPAYAAALDGNGAAMPPGAVAETDSFAIAYTSGTTGRPKGVLLPHRSRCLMFGAMAAEYGCFGRDDHFLALAPMCHGAGLAFALAPLYNGGRCTLAYSANPASLLDAIDRLRPNGIFVVPTHLHRLFAAEADLLERYRGRHGLRTIISNAAALPPHLKKAAASYFGDGLLHETYGSTEAGIVTNIRPHDLLQRPRSVGRAFSCMEIELRREDGAIAEVGEPGELFCRGPYTFNGYLNRPAETAATLVGGWVTVGDIAIRDEDGFITITDRKKDMIITGGMNVYPREVENVIESVEGVAECAVVGRPDPEWGEALTAFVVCAKDRRPTAEEVLGACRTSLAAYKVPKSVVFLDDLPRNATGKLLKMNLRQTAVATA